MRDRDEPNLPAALVALSGYGAYRAAFPTETPTWQQLADDSKDRWVRLAAFVLMLPESLENLAYTDAAAIAWHVWKTGSLDHEHQSRPLFNILLWGERLAWQAATRHMVALADSGLPDEDLDEAEAKWAAWAQRQRAPVTPVVEQLV